MLNRLNTVLLVVLLVIVALVTLMRVNHSRPNYQVMLANDMTYSPAYTAYAANKNFANGRTFQEPVAGTLARGEKRFDFAATPEDAIRAGEELTNPHAAPEDLQASADRGAVVFQTFCNSCHGGDGAGNGPVAMRGFPPPPSLLTGKSRDMKDGQLFHVLTFGQNSMPPFAVQLPPGRRWDVINYVRRLQQAAPAAPAGASAAPAAPPEASAVPADAQPAEPAPPAPAAPESTETEGESKS